MKINKVVSKRIRKSGKGVNFTGDVNAVVVANDGEGSSFMKRAKSRQRIVQRFGRTVISKKTSGSGD